ncbi:MAG: hypothetical protein WBA45_06515 [Microthrixaceae bacterium]
MDEFRDLEQPEIHVVSCQMGLQASSGGDANVSESSGSDQPGSIQGGFAAAVPLRPAGIEHYGRELVGYLKALVQPHGPTLELGAATGILTGQLTRARVDVLACERNETSLAQLRRSLPHVPALCAEVEAIPLRESAAGSVLIIRVGPGSASGLARGGTSGALLDVRELQRVLRPGGLFIALSLVGSTTVEDAGSPEGLLAPGFTPLERRLFDNMLVQVWREGPEV